MCALSKNRLVMTTMTKIMALLLLIPMVKLAVINTALVTAGEVNDVIFTDSVLWTASVRSRLDCAVLCLRTTPCIFFTYQEPVMTSCTLHAQVMTSMNAMTPHAGTQSFILHAQNASGQAETTTAQTCEDVHTDCYDRGSSSYTYCSSKDAYNNCEYTCGICSNYYPG